MLIAHHSCKTSEAGSNDVDMLVVVYNKVFYHILQPGTLTAKRVVNLSVM